MQILIEIFISKTIKYDNRSLVKKQSIFICFRALKKKRLTFTRKLEVLSEARKDYDTRVHSHSQLQLVLLRAMVSFDFLNYHIFVMAKKVL